MASPNPIYKRGRKNPTGEPMTETLKRFRTNYQTTAGGVASLLGGLVILINMFSGEQDFSTEQLAVAFGLIGTGVAGLFARDASKSSQDNNVRK